MPHLPWKGAMYSPRYSPNPLLSRVFSSCPQPCTGPRAWWNHYLTLCLLTNILGLPEPFLFWVLYTVVHLLCYALSLTSLSSVRKQLSWRSSVASKLPSPLASSTFLTFWKHVALLATPFSLTLAFLISVLSWLCSKSYWLSRNRNLLKLAQKFLEKLRNSHSFVPLFQFPCHTTTR